MTVGQADGPARLAWLAVGLIVSAGAWLRLSHLDVTGLWLDEILGVQFVGPEHGPLYYQAIRIGQALGGSETAFRLPFALAGSATVVVVALAAWRVAGAPAATVAAALVAFSPIHHYYAREARPYALLVLWSALGLWAVARLIEGRRTLSSHALVLVAIGLLVATSSNGVFHAMALLAAYGLAVAGAAPEDRRRHVGAWLGGAIVGAIVFLTLYGGMLGPSTGHRWLPDRPLLVALAAALVESHSEQGVPPATWMLPVAGALTLVGTVGLARRFGTAGAALLAAALVGFFVPVVVLETRGHWINARYVLPALVPWLLLIASGLATVTSLLARVTPGLKLWRDHIAAALALVAGLGLWLAQSDALSRSLTGRADWRHIAGIVAERAHPGDFVLATNDWTAICLGYYLPRAGASVRLENASESVPEATERLARRSLAWVVSGGHHTDDAIRRWAAPLPLVWSHPIEAVRVWFHPDRATYLTNRTTADEAAALASSLWIERGGRIVLDERAEPWLIDGWHAAERDPDGVPFRWVDGHRARLAIPARQPAPTGLTATLMPFGPVQPRQRVSWRLNDVPIGEFDVTGGWQTQPMDLSAVAWRDGVNLLEMTLTAAASPASLGLSDDPRVLGAAVRTIAFE